MQQMARKPFMLSPCGMEGFGVKSREKAIFGLEAVRPSARLMILNPSVLV
jgi:hypothetical protein